MPEISVIIPVYNQEEYVGACMDSLLDQSFEDFEVLAVNDGSTDASVSILEGYEQRDGRVQLIDQNNSGVSVARNNGLSHAKGEWVCFIDPDDYVAPDYLDTLLKATERNTDMSTCVAFDDQRSARQHFFPESFTARAADEKVELFRQLMDGSYAQPKGFVTAIGVPWGKLYRHAFLQEHGLQFDAALPRMQDNLFNMQAFQLAHEIVYVDYAGYYYRMGGLSARTYKNNARGLYHPAIDERARLMREYHLDGDATLLRAWNEEQVNLYFQELKAVIMLADPQSVKQAARTRAQALGPRLDQIDVSALSPAIRFKYTMMRNATLCSLLVRALRAKG